MLDNVTNEICLRHIIKPATVPFNLKIVIYLFFILIDYLNFLKCSISKLCSDTNKIITIIIELNHKEYLKHLFTNHKVNNKIFVKLSLIDLYSFLK